MWDAVVRAPLLMPLLLMLSGQSEPSPRHAETLPPTVQKLMKGYNRYLRPSFEEGSVVVGMSLDIASIDSISEINMDYTATIFLRQRWVDERLCFDANKSLSLDGRLVELLWVPDTFIVDSKRSFLHAVTVENRLIRIFPNGTVLYALRITATVACNMDLTKYPMDKQSCTLQLESWGYNTDDMVFYWTRGNDSVRGLENLRLAQYTVEEQFTSVSEAVYETGRYPKLVFHFVLRRNILYFILETRHHGAHHDHADDGCPRVAAQRQLLHQGHRRLPGHLLQLHLRSAARVRGGSLLHAAPPRRGDAGRPLPRRRPRQERQRLLRLARGRRRGATRAPFHLLQIRVRPGRASTADGREPTTPRGGLCAPAGCVAHDPHCKSPSRRFLHRPEPSPHRQLLQEGLPPPVCTRQPPLLVLLLVPLISHRPRPRGGKGPSLRRGRISHTGPVASGRPAPPPGDAGRFISESKKRSRAV
ncbi:gamma-aminobutyric acid receptor subunit beta-3-like isoform X3 [Lampetra fluviatilis]